MSAHGRIIFLNGTSSAGKTTVARAIQQASVTPYLWAGIDAYFAMVPPRWGGGLGGPLSRDGFRYSESTDDHGRPVVTITYGPVGRRMLGAMHASTAALTVGGNDVIIDELVLSAEMLDDWLDVLADRDVLFVGVHCDIAEIERREQARDNRPGLGRGHLHTVHAHGRYDLEIDTTRTPVAELAATVLERRECGPPPVAFAELRRQRLSRAARSGDPSVNGS